MNNLQDTTAPWSPPAQPVSVNADLCRTLRAILAQAERGELTFATVIGIGPSGQVIEGLVLAGGPAEYLMATALEAAKAKIISNIIRAQTDSRASPIIKPGRSP